MAVASSIGILMLLAFQLGINAVVSIPKLDIATSHESKQELRPGENYWYSFNISHNIASTGDAKDIKVTWYIPYYIRIGQLSASSNDIEVIMKGDVVIFKDDKKKRSFYFSGVKYWNDIPDNVRERDSIAGLRDYLLKLSQHPNTDPLKSNLAKGAVANVKFQVFLANGTDMDKGHHYAVTTITMSWYSTSSVKYTSPTTSYSMEFVVPGCSSSLGMGSGLIKSHQLIASSSLPASRPDMARYSSDAWCAKTQDANQYLQVLFTKQTRVTKIVTWGRSLKPHWIKEFAIQFSDDNFNWVSYKENGFEKIFKGNTDHTTAVSHWLMYPISANYIRILPKSWNTQMCLRFELYGCQVSHTDNCVNPIGMETGFIPDAALSHSITDASSLSYPVNARLNKKVDNYPFGWATSLDPAKKDWLQADLGSVHKLAYKKDTQTNLFKFNSTMIRNQLVIELLSYFVREENSSVTLYDNPGCCYSLICRNLKYPTEWLRITSTAVQGSSNEPESLFYVKSYKLQYSNNSVDWHIVKENGADKLFKGPESGEAAKFATPAFFTIPIYARYLRLIPEEFWSMKVLRMEIYGCVSEEKPVLSNRALPAEFSRRSTLLDSNTNTLYVCIFRGKVDETSCRSTKDGKIWNDINSRVVSIIGYENTSNILYGLDRFMSYMYTKDYGQNWVFISNEEWNRRQSETNILLSTKLNDILVGSSPSMNWTAVAGHHWGVSGDGIHMKTPSTQWSLIASWKCCGY